jgi:peptidoglycan/LPS O-acetylase OafA/YrhL
MRRLGDVSYGVYLYAFPVQQGCVAAFGPDVGPLVLAAAAALPVLALAFLSSRLVEVPALRLKRAAGGPDFVLRS